MILKIITPIFCSLNGHFSAVLSLFLARAEHFETCLLVIRAQKRKERIVTPEWSLRRSLAQVKEGHQKSVSTDLPSVAQTATSDFDANL